MYQQTTIQKNTKTALITESSFVEGGKTHTQCTAIVFVGFGTSSEHALRSKTFKTGKAASKWAIENM